MGRRVSLMMMMIIMIDVLRPLLCTIDRLNGPTYEFDIALVAHLFVS